MSPIFVESLPVQLRCLRVPLRWKLVATRPGSEYFRSEFTDSTALTEYDPWELRNEYFRIPDDDPKALAAFLDKVGCYHKPDPEGMDFDERLFEERRFFLNDEPIHARQSMDADFSLFHDLRNWFEGELLDLLRGVKHSEDTPTLMNSKYPAFKFDVAVRLRPFPSLVITTLDWIDAVSATVHLDVLAGARARKCKRPDCGVVFAIRTKHRKLYCSANCAHVQAVRAHRKPKQKRRKTRAKR